MTEQPADRTATTRVSIHGPIAARWSPRAFDPGATVTTEQLTALLEAARWAATWGGRQPVRFLVGLRGDETFAALAATLKRGNAYAHAAGALILVCADEGPDEKTALYSAVDAGAAIANASLEAVARGLVAHAMAGFDADAARTAFAVPTDVRPIAVLAVGMLGDYRTADEAIVERDTRARERLPLEEVAFAGSWGSAFMPDTSSPAV
ncbi:nitroreductase [Mycobacterium antarcticum]|uniref:nitroreductase family protein n=1 Tax=unclassified Mycolicibacterium TaxID=2636767 RepID=UPI00239E3B46|nr:MULTISPECIES: nitroreductase family protein [unclassified Mycolicibacterium]GLP73329.1 nitroreductase [Mycolicibacterium sp. TUM20983]GLP79043.1 nitroreductase [Mycolicibacterium sp. TUM20984]